MLRFVAAFVLVCALSPAAFGQIIYENVRYQYVTDAGMTYYYGGNDPRVHYWAERQSALHERGWNRYRSGRFSGNDLILGSIWNLQSPVYTDLLPYAKFWPGQLLTAGARRYGVTPADARNEAVRSAPLYFRKRDLLRSAIPQPDGSVLVPSHPQAIIVIDRSADDQDDGATRPATTRPATTSKILIIPKPAPAEKSDKPIVASR
ncbi:MAG TPA: hypothetical protein VGR35_18925 [Tepidisphaeraceae bacterium]|nr:hypothetical protein [Tepidisphaeraceae bacterium]